MKDYSFEAGDGKNIYAALWDCPNPRGIIQIVHGMAEHIARYNDFAEYLNSKGYIVAGEDHRGHGKTAGSIDETGYLADSNGWNKMVEDNICLGNKLRNDYPGLPFFIIGHSMGSFLTRNLIAVKPEGIKGVILSGTGSLPLGQIKLLKMLASVQKTFLSARKRAALIDKLSFGANNKPFTPARTGFEWLSRDEKEVDKYVADPYCGFIATIGFYLDLTDGVSFIESEESFTNTPDDLPIFLYSGDKDPVGANSEGVKKVAERYKSSGCRNIKVDFNKDGRHESLNETNKAEVYKTFSDWFDGLL